MSNFLSNLMARSRGELPAIRPRLPSLYEPRRRGSLPGGHFPEHTELSATGFSGETSCPFDSQPPSPGSLLARRGVWPAPHADPPGRANPPHESRRNPLGPSSTVPGKAQRTSDGSSWIEAGEDKPQRSRQVSGTLDAKSPEDQNQTSRQKVHDLARTAVRSGKGVLSSVVPSLAMHVRSQPAAGQPRITPRTTGQNQRRLQHSNPHETPINITIGRVEVRAVVPAPVRRASPAKSRGTVSLEDYLKRRDRGRR
jgi:hypothetical protein